jgi:hypothetical protein
MFKQDHLIVSHKNITMFFYSQSLNVWSQFIDVHVTTSWYQLKKDYEDGGMCKHVK